MTENTASQRYVFLDGIRGWAAVTVVLFHYFVLIFPVTPGIAWAMQRMLIFNGGMAVWVFFAVSGFSLSIGYIRSRDPRSLVRLAIGRYPRLMIPVFAACALVYLMMVSGLIYPPDQRPEILKAALEFEPSLTHLFQFSLFDVFFNYRQPESFITPLWTMSFELKGSALVIGLMAVFGRLHRRIWACSAVTAILMLADSYYSLFAAGIVIAELYDSGARPPKWLLICGFAAGCAVPFFSTGVPTTIALLATVAWCAACVFLKSLHRFFSSALSLWLGAISFPLYLLHAPVAYSFSIFLANHLEGAGAHSVVNFTVASASLIVSLFVAWFFVPVNDFAIMTARLTGQSLSNKFNYRRPPTRLTHPMNSHKQTYL